MTQTQNHKPIILGLLVAATFGACGERKSSNLHHAAEASGGVSGGVAEGGTTASVGAASGAAGTITTIVASGGAGAAPATGGTGSANGGANAGSGGTPDTGGSSNGGNPSGGGQGGSAHSGTGGEEPSGAGAPNEPEQARLLLTQYVEGASYDKALEIANLGGTAADLALCSIEIFINGASEPRHHIDLVSTLAPGSASVLCHDRAAPELLEHCDQITNALNFNGDDAVVLSCEGLVSDAFGQVGVDPGGSWGRGLSVDHQLGRRCDAATGNHDPSAAFDIASQWVALEQDWTALGAGVCTP